MPQPAQACWGRCCWGLSGTDATFLNGDLPPSVGVGADRVVRAAMCNVLSTWTMWVVPAPLRIDGAAWSRLWSAQRTRSPATRSGFFGVGLKFHPVERWECKIHLAVSSAGAAMLPDSPNRHCRLSGEGTSVLYTWTVHGRGFTRL